MAFETWKTDSVDSCARCRKSGQHGVILRDGRRYRDESSFLSFCWDCWPKVVKKVESVRDLADLRKAQGEAARATAEGAMR